MICAKINSKHRRPDIHTDMRGRCCSTDRGGTLGSESALPTRGSECGNRRRCGVSLAAIADLIGFIANPVGPLGNHVTPFRSAAI